MSSPTIDKDAATSQADGKVLATLQARAALAGFELVPMADGTFIASRWGRFQNLEDPAAVERWLDQVDGRRQERAA